VRAIVLESERFVGKTVTVIGQFRAGNLFNDLPAEPGGEKHKFVIKAGKAAVWVVGLRPRMNGADLNMKSRADTDRWLAVEGIVRRGKGLVWIEASRMASAPTPAEALPPPPQAPLVAATPEVMFSLPADDEADVPITTKVRIQFTRPIDPSTLTDRIRVTYAGRDAAAPGEPVPPFAVDYATSDCVVTLRFRTALERFRTVTVELLDGIATATGTRATPWRLTFTTGGQE
jgi:hypothetical protein